MLPPAEKYGTVRFRINGGVVDAGNRAGFLTVSNKDEPLGRPQALSPRGGWHLGATRRASAMDWHDRAIYWMVNPGLRPAR